MAEALPGGGRVLGVLVTYRRPAALATSLDVLARQTRPPDVVVVVDNDADESGRPVVDERGRPWMRYLATGTNLGPAGGIATGMTALVAEARAGDWILVLDDDDPLGDERVIADLVGAARRLRGRDPSVAGVGLAGARLDRRRGRLVRVAGGEGGEADADYLKSDRSPLYAVEAVRAVGGFAAPLFFGFDDLEYGLRLRAAGYRLVVRDAERPEPNPRTPRPSLALEPVDWRRYYSLRNLVHLLRTDGHVGAAVRVAVITGVAKPLANLPRAPALALAHLRLNLRAVRDGWQGRLGCTVPTDSAPRPGGKR